MKSVMNIAIIGNSFPRRCGIATFTNDLESALSKLGSVRTTIIALSDHGADYDYPPHIGFQIDDQNRDDYGRAADFINKGGFDAVILQHEFGIFGGDAGSYVLELISRLTMPLITVLHTVLDEPSVTQRYVMNKLLGASARVIVMTEKGKSILQSVYHMPRHKIDVIAHGIADKTDFDILAIKKRLGLLGKKIILTFGLLSPNKGIEVMIDAMPAIVKNHKDVIYVVLGATHPHLVRQFGESHREGLIAHTSRLGLNEHISFVDQYVDQDTLLDYIAIADLYVTPYLDVRQMTSGTLSLSFGMGKAVVSTPYWHATDLLADGRGVLVPFGSSEALAKAILDLLGDDERRQSLGANAFEIGRSMIWSEIAKDYRGVIMRCMRLVNMAPLLVMPKVRLQDLRPIQSEYFRSLCDSTGIFQHAIYDVADRSHGYCLDDNARALILSCQLAATDYALPKLYGAQFCAFIEHAYNPDKQRFRNFMSYNRSWLEEVGSEDSHGRALWALGVCAEHGQGQSQRHWARRLFEQALGPVEGFASPRALAFTLLGLKACNGDLLIVKALADRLKDLFDRVETPSHIWFETHLTYDNARLSEAMLAAGAMTGNPSYTEIGLRSLGWLIDKQTAPEGHFRAVGTDGYLRGDSQIALFDQQPLEAQGMVAACRVAWEVTKDKWFINAMWSAFAWFVGRNDLNLSLVDIETGRCCDGLHRDRVNQNCGAESVLAYLMSQCDLHQLYKQITHSLRQDPSDITLTPQKAARLATAGSEAGYRSAF